MNTSDQSGHHKSVRDITTAGMIRAALFLPQHSTNPVTGELRGHGTGYVGMVMTRLLAERLGVKAEILGMATPALVMDALLAGDIDLAFFGIEPGRAAKVDFTPPMFCFDYTFLVPALSPGARFADVDRAGVRIVIVENHASALALRPLVRHAAFVSAELPDQAFEILRAGQADAFACPRDVLLDYAVKLPGSRALDDAFGVNRVGIALRKGQPELHAFVSSFVEEAKASGVVADAIEQGHLRGFTVADSSGNYSDALPNPQIQ